MSSDSGRSGMGPAGLINLLPEWMRSARFRITILYSTVLFLIAAVLLGTLYFALLQSLHSDEPLYKRYGFIRIERDGDRVLDGRIVDAPEFERQVNQHALETLREFSFGALGVLFVVSLGVGWVISGRVLSPIDRITSVANEIQATDLSRRIDLGGPADELKRLADTFDGMLGRLDAAFDAQRRFIADASHELRNPLAVMRTNIDVVLADPHASNEDLRHAASVVQRATDRMRRLVDDLLALARLEAPSAVKEHVDLAEVVSEAVEELRAVASARDVTIAMASAPGASAAGDREALKRALVNLIDNALRFGPAGSRVAASSGRSGPWVWLAVVDEGPGIDPEHHERVFERFWRADKGRSRALGGSGLGLAIVRQIAEGHGGAVRVYSTPGAGATFVLWLPALGARRVPNAAEIPRASPSPAWISGAPFASA
jgi:signal transduction histidine kinase